MRARAAGLVGWLLLWPLAAAAADPFLAAPAEREPAPLPDRYRGALPAGQYEPDPSPWRGRLDWVPDGPTHFQQQVCREGSPERARFLRALRQRGAALDRDADLALALPGRCPDGSPSPALCAWLRAAAGDEPPGPSRAFLLWQLVACSQASDAPLYETPGTPDAALVAFRERHPVTEWSRALEAVVRRAAREGGVPALGAALEAFARVDDERVAAVLVDLHAAARDPEQRQALGLAARHQSQEGARKIFGEAWLDDCEQRRARARALRTQQRQTRIRFSLPEPPSGCSEPPPVVPPPPAPTPDDGVRRFSYPPHVARLRRALARFDLEPGLLRFAPSGADVVGFHAPLLRRLAALAGPDLEELVVEEVWPALDAFEFERGPEPGWVQVEGDGFRVKVPGAAGGPDPRVLERVRGELAEALAEPHHLDAYLGGERLRFEVRGLGRFWDVETLVGGLNTLLAAAGSGRRALVLEPVDFVEVVVGPADVLLAALRAGAITPGDPFAAARLSPDFAEGGAPRAAPSPAAQDGGSSSSVGTPRVPSRSENTRVPGRLPGRTSETSSPAEASRARAASASGTR